MKEGACVGKQMNYWMDYDIFVLLAQKALDMGCVIYRRSNKDSGKLVFGTDIGIVIPEEKGYFFHFPEAGELIIGIQNEKECISESIGKSGNALIEAGFSFIDHTKKRISRARIYCSSGYYDKDGAFIGRPELLTKAYNSLARYVKKIAPYTELTDSYISSHDKDYGQEIAYIHKEYVSHYCNEKRFEGYKLVASL